MYHMPNEPVETEPIPFAMTKTLLPDGTLVECQLLALKNVSIAASTLARPGGDHGVETTCLELALQCSLNLSALLALSVLLVNAVALLLLSSCILLLLPPPAQAQAVVCFVPLSEGCGIDLDDRALGQGVCSDEFVVGRMERHADNTGLAGDGFGAPREVARVEAEGAELAVAATGADEMDALGADTGVGGLTTLLESSLLAVVCPLRTSSRTLMAGVS